MLLVCCICAYSPSSSSIFAFVDIIVATVALPAISACAAVCIDTIIALSTVETCSSEAIVDVHFASRPFPSTRARTGEFVDAVLTGASVEARIGIRTIVDVDIAVLPCPARLAITSVRIQAVDALAMETSVSHGTVVDAVAAARSGPALGTITVLAIDFVDTDTAIVTIASVTVINIDVAVFTRPSSLAVADIVI